MLFKYLYVYKNICIDRLNIWWFYSRMATALKRSSNNNANQSQTRGTIYNRRTVIKMQGNYEIKKNYKTYLYYRKILGLIINYILYLIVAVITSFLICWTPYHVLRNMYVITSITNTRTSSVVNTEETLHVLSGKPSC